SKCDDSMPIYRIRDRYARLGFDVPLKTLYRYWTFGTDLLLALAEVTLGVVLDDDIVCLDDTGMPVPRRPSSASASSTRSRRRPKNGSSTPTAATPCGKNSRSGSSPISTRG